MIYHVEVALPEDHVLAEQLATSAGKFIQAWRSEQRAAGATVRELQDGGDKAAHDFIVAEISKLRPDDLVLSEEDLHAPATAGDRQEAPRVWIVDPVDGTYEFGHSRPDWAVHIALVENHQPTAAAVAVPDQSLTRSTAQQLQVPELHASPRFVSSRSRPPWFTHDLVRHVRGQLLSIGSAGAKAMAIVEGNADAYVHAGGQYEWDSAAPVGVARHAGLHCSRIDGSPLLYNQEDPYLPDLLICHPDLADPILTWLEKHG